jgi:cellulose synthase/poly-beta-1,6-N-acetylglucosamine synthase-like glycosyltransferase
MFVAGVILFVLAAFTAAPSLLLLAECVAAVLNRKRNWTASLVDAPGPDTVYLVPAHNEGENLKPTLGDIVREMRPGDRLVVVADNCTDNTAEAAAEFGAEVLHRKDETRWGKGYALAYGIDYLNDRPPQVVVVIDADCRIEPGFGRAIAAEAVSAGRPVQGKDLMRARSDGPAMQSVAEFAWIVKNEVRPLGLAALAMPCQLAGTGMAIPWEALKRIDLGSSALAEDLKLGADLALAGFPPKYLPGLAVTSTFPNTERALLRQRQRWEIGSFTVLLRYALPILASALRRRDLPLVVLALDLSVPPLMSYLAILIAMTLVSGAALALGVGAGAFVCAVAGLFAWTSSVVLSWLAFGQRALPLSRWPGIVRFVVQKKGIYAFSQLGGKLRWHRTDRSP